MIDLKVKKKKWLYYLTDTRFLLALLASLIGFFAFNFGLSHNISTFFCFVSSMLNLFFSLDFFNFFELYFLNFFVPDDFF